VRARAAVLAAVALLAGAWALMRGDEPAVYTHDGEPGFTLTYDDELLELEQPDGALVSLRGERKGLVATVEARALSLPDYDGSVTGLLPVYAAERARGLDVTVDTRARLGGAPGYEIGYALPDGSGTLLFVVPDEAARTGVELRFEQRQDPGRDRGGGRSVSLAARSALRSFGFSDAD
jgi:hypothetical protein